MLSAAGSLAGAASAALPPAARRASTAGTSTLLRSGPQAPLRLGMAMGMGTGVAALRRHVACVDAAAAASRVACGRPTVLAARRAPPGVRTFAKRRARQAKGRVPPPPTASGGTSNASSASARFGGGSDGAAAGGQGAAAGSGAARSPAASSLPPPPPPGSPPLPRPSPLGIGVSLAAVAVTLFLGRLVYKQYVEPRFSGGDGDGSADGADSAGAQNGATADAVSTSSSTATKSSPRGVSGLSGADADALFGPGRLREPQSAVLAGSTSADAFVTLRLPWRGDKLQLSAVVAHLGDLVSDAIADDGRASEASVAWAVGFGPSVWQAIEESSTAAIVKAPEVFALKARSAKGGQLPSTGGDVFVHVKTNDPSLTFDVVRKLRDALPESVVRRDGFDDVYGFAYRGGRDFAGLPVSAGAPATAKDRFEAGVHPGVGGSYVLTQKWVHDMAKLRDTSAEDINAKIAAAAAAATEAEAGAAGAASAGDGADKTAAASAASSSARISRSAAPFTTGLSKRGESGLFVVHYGPTPGAVDAELDRLAGSDGELQLSLAKCASGALYYVPSKAQLTAVADGLGSPWANE